MNHIIATFHLASDVEQPKVRGVRSGYAPHHRFPAVGYLASGVHSYADNELHYPGETLKVRIAFPSWVYFSDKVKVGDSFDVLELDRVIGRGTVDEILSNV